MAGTVDEHRRPLLRLQLRDGGHILALVDTGFNGQLWMSRADATALGIDHDENYSQTGHAIGMRPVETAEGQLVIHWLGQERVVDVIVDIDSTHRTIAANEPAALIGTELLDPAALSINFEKRTCVVRGQ